MHRGTIAAVLFAAALAYVLAAGAGASARRGGTGDDRDNAARHYNEAFEMLERLRSERPGDFDALTEFAASPDAPLTPAVEAALRRAEPILDHLRRGASESHVDWGVDYSAGPNTLLPHLSPLRHSGRLLAADARARLASGDVGGATDVFAAGLRMADHATADPVLINSLVGAAMFQGVNNNLSAALGEGRLDPANARTLLESVRSIAADDPLGLVGSLERERSAFAGWMLEHGTGEGGKERILEMLGEHVPIDIRAADMSQEEFDTAIRAYDLAHQHVAEAIACDDLELARAEIDDILRDVKSGAYGPLASAFMPALDNYLDRMIAIYDDMDDLLRDLETVAAGPEGALAVRNAALWYLRAIDAWEALDAADREAIDAYAQPAAAAEDDSAEPSATPGATAHAALERAAPIIEFLLEAATIERCDFDLRNLWRFRGPTAKLDHLDGMRACARLLAADANRALDHAEVEEEPAARAALRIASIYRMTTHLASDRRIASVRSGMEVADLASRVLQSRGGEIARSADGVAAIREAIDGVHDFGYRGAVVFYPEATVNWLVTRAVRRLSIDSPDYVDRVAVLIEEGGGEVGGAFEKLTPQDVRAAIVALEEIVDVAQGLCVEARPWEQTAALDGLMDDYAETYPRPLAEWLVAPLRDAALGVQESSARLAEARAALDTPAP